MDATTCPRCGVDTVHDAVYCHRCGAALVARPARPHVAVVIVVVALLVAGAVGWAFLPGNPAAVAFSGTSAVLVAPAEAPAGTSVGPLPARYVDALGVAANPARLPPEAVDGFAETFGTRPAEAWVEFVAVEGSDVAGVLLFSFHWRDPEDAGAAARSFVGSAGCSDVDVALAGGPDVVALVAVGSDAASLAGVVDAVAAALTEKAPGLEDVCASSAPAADAPRLELHSAYDSTLRVGEPVALLVHAEGPDVDWSASSLRLTRDGAPTVALSFSTTGRCEDATLAPYGVLAAGERLLLCAADDRWEVGAELGARLLARGDGQELWAGAVVLV